jgi:hypothetical protein
LRGSIFGKEEEEVVVVVRAVTVGSGVVAEGGLIVTTWRDMFCVM